MKKALKKSSPKLFYYFNSARAAGKHPLMYGDCKCLYGDCSRLLGDCSEVWGDCSGLRGDCTGVVGDFDKCDISDEERSNGIYIIDLVEE